MISVLHISFGKQYPTLGKNDPERSAAWICAYWETLRCSLFEGHRFPPLGLLDPLLNCTSTAWEQSRDQTFQQLDAWQWRRERPPTCEDDFHTIFTPPVDDVSPGYFEVGHLHGEKEHYDLFRLAPDGNDELFFDPRGAEHGSILRDTFFVPLMMRTCAATLDLDCIDMSISYANERGLHTVGLSSFLRTLGVPTPRNSFLRKK